MLTILNTAKEMLAPYLVWAKVAAFVLCGAVGTFLGYRYGVSTHATAEAQKSVQIVQLAAENAALRQANVKNANAVAEANRIVAENQKKASDVQEEGMTQAELVRQANEALDRIKKANVTQASIEKCAEQMKEQVCSTVPLP